MNTELSGSNIEETPPRSADGSLIAGRYRLLEKLGEGAAAEVYRAWDEHLERVVAVKLMRPQYVRDETWRKRFAIEAKAAAGLSNPHIVSSYDFGDGPGGTMFIAMQYVEGENLGEVLRRQGKLSPLETVTLARQVCDALAEAHSRGLIHRDVKPQNIMITGAGAARLMDFGIVKTLTATALTQSGMTFGTASYLSPEQATGVQVGPTSDIYALGCVMYEMLSGAPPFVGDNPISVAYKQVWEQPRPLNEVAPDVPHSLESIVMRCLEKEPSRRYATADILSTHLKSVGESLSRPAEQAVAAPLPINGTGTDGTRHRANTAVPIASPAAATVVRPVRVQPSSAAPVPFGQAGAGNTGPASLTINRRKNTAWLPLAVVFALLVLSLAAFAIMRGNLFGGAGNRPPASPTATAQSQIPTPTALGAVIIEVPPTETATETSTPENTETPISTDTPVPVEVPPTDTPVPPTATEVPAPPPTNTPKPTKPRPTKPPAPPTDTPVPLPPTDTPVPTATEPPPTPGITPTPSSLEQAVDEAIAGNPQAVSDYLGGKKTALFTLLGDIIAKAKGKIDLDAARDLLIRKLEELRHLPTQTPNP